MTPSPFALALACFGTFTGFLTIGIPLPVIPDFVHGQLGFDMFLTGTAIGLQSLATVMTRKTAGHRADTVGGRATARRGLLLCAAAGATYVVSSVVAPSSASVALGVFLGGRVLLGLGESQLITGVLTWGIGLVGAPRTGKVMSWNGIAMHAALALGAPGGVFLQGRFGFTAVAVVALMMPLLGYVATHFAEAPALTRTPSLEVAFARTVRAIWREGVGVALGTFAFGALSAFITVYFRAHDWPYAGQVLLVFGFCYIGVRLLFGHLPDRIGGMPVAAVSVCVEALGQLTLWWADSPAVALVGVALTGAGFSLVVPAFGVQALRRVPPERRGTALGAFSAFFDVALGSTGPTCGFLIAHVGVSSIYLLGALTSAAALGLVGLAHRARGQA